MMPAGWLIYRTGDWLARARTVELEKTIREASHAWTGVKNWNGTGRARQNADTKSAKALYFHRLNWLESCRVGSRVGLNWRTVDGTDKQIIIDLNGID